MAASGELVSAMTTRSLRMVRTELEFLSDASVITPQQLSSILSQLPSESDARVAAREQQLSPQPPQQLVQPTSVHAQSPPAPYSPPANHMAKTSLDEKAGLCSQYTSPPPQPPPAYPQVPPIPSLATALYAYTPTDPGDLALQPRDRIQVLEHMNDDWWRGRNERTGLEGIFPRSYVNVVDEKAPVSSPPPTNYGNMPLEVSQSGSSTAANNDQRSDKFQQGGKKFGKKLGNAAIFGAGASVGSNIVNSIF